MESSYAVQIAKIVFTRYIELWSVNSFTLGFVGEIFFFYYHERWVSPFHWGPARGGSHVARLNIKTSCVGVYKCLSLIVGFAVTVAIWLREVVSCRNFILRAVATFWTMSLVGIYPGRASSLSCSVMPASLREEFV